jgi:hypothetical protein
METGERFCSQKERSFNQHEVWKLMDKGIHRVMPHMGRLHSFIMICEEEQMRCVDGLT